MQALTQVVVTYVQQLVSYPWIYMLNFSIKCVNLDKVTNIYMHMNLPESMN